jgi:hypothetical protein
MHDSSVSIIALAAALSSVALPGHATTVASTTLSGFRITVTDLDPSDGIDATVAFDPLSRSNAIAGFAAPGANSSWSAQGAGPFGAAAVSGILDGTGTGGAASISGDPFGAGATFSGSGVGASDWGDGLGGTYIDTQPTGQTLLTLSAHSELSFSGLASLHWLAGAPMATANGNVDMGFLLDAILVDRAAFSAGYDPFSGAGGGLAGTASDALSISFSNSSDVPVVLGYYVNVSADASEVGVVPSPVGEPAGAALLLVGLVPAWFALRRRGG